MKYFLIAGEASGDLHASRLIQSIREEDAAAEFRFLGGDLMEAAAGKAPIHHYR
jgi:lipid-A-disaccharide synthase